MAPFDAAKCNGVDGRFFSSQKHADGAFGAITLICITVLRWNIVTLGMLTTGGLTDINVAIVM